MGVISGASGCVCCGVGYPEPETPCSCWFPLPLDVDITGLGSLAATSPFCGDPATDPCVGIDDPLTVPGYTLGGYVIEEICQWTISSQGPPPYDEFECEWIVDVFLNSSGAGYRWYVEVNAGGTGGGGTGNGWLSDVILCDADIFDEVTLSLSGTGDCDDSIPATITLTPQPR